MSGALAEFDAEAYRWGSSSAPWLETVVIMSVIAVLALICVCAFIVHQRRRERRVKPVADEWQALAVMGELCPHGWKAHVTLRGRGAPVPEDAPASSVPPVELEWKQFEAESQAVAASRRVWAPSIGAALQKMAEDRFTDATLERIERAAAGERDVRWND